jgi:hypothetical protein
VPAIGAHVRLVTDDKRFIRSLEVLAPAESDEPARSATSHRDKTITRLAVLKAASHFAADRIDIKSTDVLQIAERWLQWIES